MRRPAFILFAFLLFQTGNAFADVSTFQWGSAIGLRIEKQIYKRMSLSINGLYSIQSDSRFIAYSAGPVLNIDLRHYFQSVSFERLHIGITIGSFYQALQADAPYIGMKIGTHIGDRYALVINRGWYFENRLILEPFIRADIILPVANRPYSSIHADYLISVGANIALLFALY